MRGSDSGVEEVRDQLGITPGEPVADAGIRVGRAGERSPGAPSLGYIRESINGIGTSPIPFPATPRGWSIPCVKGPRAVHKLSNTYRNVPHLARFSAGR